MHQNQKSRKWRFVLLVFLVATIMLPKANVNALTQKQKALNAYNKFLAKSSVPIASAGKTCYRSWQPYTYKGTKASQVLFGLAYIDNDGIPELVLKTTNNGSTVLTSIFTYTNGKVKRVLQLTNDYAHIDGYYYKANSFKYTQLDEGGDKEEYYSVFNKGKTYRKLRKDSNTYGYYAPVYRKVTSDPWGGVISQSEFVKIRKNMTRSKTLSKIKYYKDTAYNRKRILR